MRNLTFKSAMWKGSQPTVNRQSTDGQSQRHCKQTPLSKRWKVLMTLVFLFTLAIGQMWGVTATPTPAGTYAIGNSKAGGQYRFLPMLSGSVYNYRMNNSSYGDAGMKLKGNDNAVIVYLGSSMDLTVTCTLNKDNKGEDAAFTVYTIAKTSFDEIISKENQYSSDGSSRTVQISTTGTQASFTVEIPNNVAKGTFTGSPASALPAGYYYIVGSTLSDGNGNVYFTSITLAAGSGGGGGDPECPAGLAISGTAAYTEGQTISLTANKTAGNGEITYTWYKGADLATAKAAGALGTGATYTKSNCVTGDAGKYFCEATKTSCSGAASSGFDVTVEADPKCFNMPEITSKPSDLAHVTVTGGTLSDASVNGKAIAFKNTGLGLGGGNDARLKVTLTGASIVEGTKITINYNDASTDGNGSGLAIYDGDHNNKTLNSTGLKNSGSVSHTFTAEEAANYDDEFIIDRNQTGKGIIMGSITVEDCGPAVTKHTITLNYNDGVTPNGSIKVVDGKTAAAKKPTDPTRGKYTFLGWFVGDTDNEYVWSTAVIGDITLKAHWQDPWTITFDEDGGSEVADITVKHNTKAEKPADPTKENHDFNGWYYGNPEVAFNWDANVTQDYSLKAHWLELVAKYDIEYYDGETKIGTEEQVRVDQHPTAAGIETSKPLMTFDGWFLNSALTGEPVALNTVTPSEGLKIYGKWSKAYAANIDFEAFIDDNTTSGDWEEELDDKLYAISSTTGVTLDAPNGKPADKGLKIKNSGSYLSFNVHAGKLVLLKAGVLSGAEASVDGGAHYTTLTGATGSTAASVVTPLYNAAEAEYRIRTTTGSYNIIQSITIQDPYQVTFNANGGDPVASQDGTPSVILPDASNGTSSLLGWFDAAEGGNKIGDVGDSYTPTADIELFAHWEAVSTDARLASITFSATGTLSPAFDPEVTSYTYTMPYGTAAIPTITGATSVSTKAQDPIIGEAATAWGGSQTIKGVAQSGDKKTYTITMQVAPKDGVVIIHADIPSGTSADYAATGLYAGTGNSKNEGSSLKLGTNHYAGVNLSGSEIFKKGDILNIHVKTKNGFVKAPISTTNAVDGSGVIFTEERSFVVGDNFITLTSAFEEANSSSLYLVRTTAIDAECNPAVDYIEVTRAMNPVLTAISFNGVAATKGTGNAFAVTLPKAGTDLADMEIVQNIIRNAAHATTPQAVVSNEGAWKEGANTYRVMDKDGDYTDYTITITLQGEAPAPVITTDLADVAYCAGNEPKLEVEATGNELHYAWFKEAGETDEAVGTDLASYTVEAAGTYYVIVTNHVDGKLDKSVTSENAVVTMNVAAEITTQPVGLSAEAGDAVSLSVVATNATSYQWYKDGVLIAGAEAATYEFTAPAATASYYCVVGNACGDALTSKTAQVAIEAGDCNWIGAGQTIAFPAEKNVETAIGTTSLKMKTSKNINTSNVKYGDVDVANTLKMDGNYIDIYTADHNIGVIQASNTSNGDNVYNYCVIFCSSNTWNEEKILSVVELAGNNKHNTEIAVVAAPMGTKFARIQRYYEWNETAYGTNSSSYLVKVRVCEIEAAPEADVTVTSEPASQNVCALGDITALSYVLEVEDGASISYQWYNADGDVAIEGANDASYTPAAVGTYYCKAVATKTGKMPKDLQSASATIVLNTATAITTAPANQRGAKDAQVTLSVVATGTNLSYEWFTCTNQAGEGAVALDPAQTGTSINVTITENMSQWYKVVVSGDCGEVFATALVEEWHEVAPANVTGSRTWDWTTAGMGEIATESGSVEYLMANVSSKVPNTEAFRSDMLYITGNYVNRKSDNKVFQGTQIRFYTEIPGQVSLECRAIHEHVKITINENVIEAERGGSMTPATTPFTVPSGWVTIVFDNISTGEYADEPARVQKLIFTAREDMNPTKAEESFLGGYERDVTEGRYGTICLPNGGVMVGATIYTLAYYGATSQKIFFDEVLNGEMEAGKPYLFLPNEGIDRIGVFYSDAEGETAKSINGFVGYIGASEDDYTQVPAGEGNYIVQNNQYREIQAGATAYILSHRAYIKFSEIGTTEPAKAPGVRRIGIGGEAPAVTTGVEGLHIGDQPVKVMINGQIFILRGEKMYDATGRLVK